MQRIVVGDQRFAIGQLIGKGGEGEVYALADGAGIAAKIYNADLRAGREEKIRAMVGQGLAAGTDLVAYPGKIVTDLSGNFLGFVMRLVSGYRPMHELYSPKSRQRHFVRADYRFVVRAALNIARAVGTVHRAGCVIGDLNHSGVLVSQDATVALIDADSFQFQADGKTFPCVVGVPDFTPPELHGARLDAVARTAAHDNFGLAVAIFHLLFAGRHPYAGVYKGPDTSIGEAIAQNRFAYSLVRRKATRTSPPPGALTLESFPEPVSTAFEHAFGLDPAARPDAAAWVAALGALEGALDRCGRVGTHHYPSAAARCVWCELATRSGFDMFPDMAATPLPQTSAIDVGRAIRELSAVRLPTLAKLLPPPTAASGERSQTMKAARGERRYRTIAGLLLVAGAAAAFRYVPEAWFITLGLGAWGLKLAVDRRIDPAPFLRAFETADKNLQHALDGFVRRIRLSDVIAAHADAEAAIARYRTFDADFANALAEHKTTREARQLRAHLDRFEIRQAAIPGIGPAKTATLISFGIETAADVNAEAVLQVPGFGEAMAGKLMDWRRGHEARFRYDPRPNAQDVADEQALRTAFANEKAALVATIAAGLSTMRGAGIHMDALPAMAHSDAALSHAVDLRTQAENELRLLGATVPKSAVSLRTVTRFQPSPPSRAPAGAAGPIKPRRGRSRISPDCPKCRAPMRRNPDRNGPTWVCARRPRCRGTRP
ncbi:MAG: hypothetical protein R3F55_08450 [Alphaproteobacteria bacterium]